ncbi:MAG: hypothetical protein RSD88_06640 [Anaerovoracaceae bacterium]
MHELGHISLDHTEDSELAELERHLKKCPAISFQLIIVLQERWCADMGGRGTFAAGNSVAYHPEPRLNNGNRQENVLHVHDYPQRNNFAVRPLHRITNQEYQLYKKYFKGVPKIDKW